MIRLLSAGLALALLATGAARAQENFRITYQVDRSNPAHARVTGWVFNDAPLDVLDVYVTAEALDSGGKVVARGIAFVASQIGNRGGAPFSATVPAMPGTSRFRVRVTSFRFGLGPQSP
jgi:hypothetical protein